MLRFVGNGDQKKFTKNPAVFQCKIPRQTRKIFTKLFWRAGNVTIFPGEKGPHRSAKKISLLESPGHLFGETPLRFLQKPLLDTFPLHMHEDGSIRPFGPVFASFIVLKNVVFLDLGVSKGRFGGLKGQMVNLGSRIQR